MHYLVGSGIKMAFVKNTSPTGNESQELIITECPKQNAENEELLDRITTQATKPFSYITILKEVSVEVYKLIEKYIVATNVRI